MDPLIVSSPDIGTADTLVVIPARMASTRLPNKPLADIHGKPMILHVWERAMAAGLGPVVVASGDAAITDAVNAAGGWAVATDPAHPSGSDRVFEAVRAVDPNAQIKYVVNVQGDLPTIEPGLIARALDPVLASPDADIATLVCEIADEDERTRPSVVKAVIAWDKTGETGRALYFTRATAPWGPGPLYHHIGLYAYRRAALERFVSLPPGQLEKRESLEQLRALEAGMRIDAALVRTMPLGVDTADDLERARQMLGV